MKTWYERKLAAGLVVAGLALGMAGCASTTCECPDDGAEELAESAQDEYSGLGVELADSEQLPVGDSPVYGAPDAPVTIVEFTSMQCPFCARAGSTLDELVEQYPGDVRLVFKHFPLGMQQQARPASIAVEAAQRQGKAWEMKSGLFGRLDEYRGRSMEELAAEVAEELGMDVEQFRADFNDPEVAAIVDADQKLGQKLGVRGTPHFFINGEVVNGAQPLHKFAEVVDRKLEEVEALRADGVEEEQLYAAAVTQNLEASDGRQAQPRPEPEPKAPEVHMVDIHDYDHAKGASEDDALVTIMEFSSFQCPFCNRGAQTLSQLVEIYPDEVRVVFKHFPLGFQEHSEPASRAAVAAGEQDKFWEMYDLLYDNQRQLGQDGMFTDLAEEIGLDIAQFESDFESEATAEIVRNSQAEGRSAGIRGTPGFLINGVKVTGAQPLRVFEGHIKQQIEVANTVKEDTGLSGNELHAAIVEHNKEHLAAPPEAAPEREEPPTEPAVIGDDALSVGDSYVKGADDAPITIYEFSSFQCPFCARAANTTAQILDEYDGKVRLVYKNFPLPFQEYSQPAAKASLAAGEQGKFWEMYEALYENQRQLGQDGIFEDLAEELGLDIAQFLADFESDAIAEQVEAEQQEGKSVGVKGTPAFFINGENLAGAQPADKFREVIDRHLEELE